MKLDRLAICKSLNISERTLEDWSNRGLPHQKLPGDKGFSLGVTVAWTRGTETATRAGIKYGVSGPEATIFGHALGCTGTYGNEEFHLIRHALAGLEVSDGEIIAAAGTAKVLLSMISDTPTWNVTFEGTA